MASINLTAKQKIFYETVTWYITRHGVAPTVAELRKKLKLSSPRAVTQYLQALERKGMIVRDRYAHRGIRLVPQTNSRIINVPVIASAGCDNISIFAQQSFGNFICVAADMLQGRQKEHVVSIKAVGDSMVDAGIKEGDYVLVEITQSINAGDLVVAVIDSFAVIKKIEFTNNAIVLHPVSADPVFKPIIVNKDFQLFGKVIDVIRMPQKGDIEIVPVYHY